MIRRSKTLYNAATAGTGAWVKLDSRYEIISTRTIQGTVASGDSIAIQATSKDFKPGNPYPVKGVSAVLDETTFLNNLLPAEITTLITFTADFNDIINGPWSYIRVVKTGTTGNSEVTGMV